MLATRWKEKAEFLRYSFVIGEYAHRKRGKVDPLRGCSKILVVFLSRKKQTRFSNCNLIFYHLHKIVLLYCTAKHYYSQRGKLYLNTSKYALQKEIIYFKAKWMGATLYSKWSLNSNNLQTETISKKNDLKTETIFLFYRWKKYRGNLIYLWLISIIRRGFNISSLSILS